MASTPWRALSLLQHAGLVLVLSLATVTASFARPISPFDRAERMREALESKSPRTRTPADYERVLDAFRTIYRGQPGNPQADAAVDAVASLLAEEGRVWHERRLLVDAVGQYAYLRRQYPASPLRENALLRQAEIEQSDLHERAQAQQLYAEFRQQYPHSSLGGEARQQQRALGPRSSHPEPSEQGPQPRANTTESARAAQAAANAREHAQELAELNSIDSDSGPPRSRTIPSPASSRQAQNPDTQATLQPANVGRTPMRSVSGKTVFITGIRHWSTPVYTRVAIDLSDEVSYEAARVPNPDRIYFDLHGARLASELVGRSVDVKDDGYLRRVRAAQYANDSTRIVLDVSHVSEYSAFLLPNPWRLIIDIHGAAANGAVLYGSNPAETKQPMASTTQEVASLGSAPSRVRATRHATTAPIAASVRGTKQAAQPNELEDLASGAPAAAAVPAAVPAAAQAAVPASVQGPPAPVRRVKHKTAPAGDTQLATNTVPYVPTLSAGPLAPEIPAAGAHEATPTSTGERSLVRALGLKIGRIVIDAGHGGHDSGTLGPDGIEEKDVVLDVALRLGKLLKQRLGADVIYTRSDDTFIPLETRTAIANKAQADLFISVHANSSHDPSARGVEVYYLNFTTSPEALEVAARENAVSDQSIYQLSDLVKKITLKDKIDESREFAADVEDSLYSGLEIGNRGLKDRGVKKAPFVVLIGANMPSILAEISFLTNPDDARELRDPAYRERIAESLYRGVARYVSGLSGVRVAQNGRPAQ